MYGIEVYNGDGTYTPIAYGNNLEDLITDHRSTLEKENCRIVKTLLLFNVKPIKGRK